MRQFTWMIRWSAAVAAALGGTTLGPWLGWPAVTFAGVVGLALCVGAALRRWRRLEGELTDLRYLAETARTALLHRMPRRCGPVDIAARYRAAARYGGVGGDLYDVVNTPFGVRVLIGDVKGHGLPAFALAAEALRTFRELAGYEPTLGGIVRRLDAHLAGRRPAPAEEFLTALLLQIPVVGNTAELVCCGHPEPLAIRGGRVAPIGPLDRALPLGLLGFARAMPVTNTIAFGGGDRLLLYTDGMTEARDGAGDFFPFAEKVAELVARPVDDDGLLARLEAAVLRHNGGRLRDDIAMLLLARESVPADSQSK
jgi:serine phosphatase RsbU (regulator of sigma subunit)